MMHKMPDIGYRAAEEFLSYVARNDITYTEATKRLDMSIQGFYAWGNGSAPSAYALSKMHQVGCDVIYILSGKRNG